MDALVRTQLRSRAVGVQVASMDDLRESLLHWGGFRARGRTRRRAARPRTRPVADRGTSAATLALPAMSDGQLLAANDASEVETMPQTLPTASYVGLVCPRTSSAGPTSGRHDPRLPGGVERHRLPWNPVTGTEGEPRTACR
ncbi:hypothetical protein [Mariniluteicoccus endophyticus]